jgi:hypothetical protein
MVTPIRMEKQGTLANMPLHVKRKPSDSGVISR